MEMKSENELPDTKAVSNMYADAKTWSPFKGCKFDCIYCVPSFQKQAKRQMHNCMDCYNYMYGLVSTARINRYCLSLRLTS